VTGPLALLALLGLLAALPREVREVAAWKYAYFGILESAVAALLLYALHRWGRGRGALPPRERRAWDLEAFGLVLLFAALWLLCGVLGLGIRPLTVVTAPLFLGAAACFAAGFAMRGRG
jgi:hypothetical protein